MNYTRQEIEEKIEALKTFNRTSPAPRTPAIFKAVDFALSVLQLLQEGKIGELPKPQEVMGREEIEKI